jgi:hypothetical protein
MAVHPALFQSSAGVTRPAQLSTNHYVKRIRVASSLLFMVAQRRLKEE